MDHSTSPRRRSRRGEGDRLRAEIVEAVNRLLDTWGGDEKLTMRAVAQEVGVAAPSIYLHFSDKASLVAAALADKYAQLAAAMEAAAAAVEPGPRKRLTAQVHAYCEFAMANPGHYRMMYEIRQTTITEGGSGNHPARHVSDLLRSELVACTEAGYPLALPLYQAAHTLWAGLHGLVSAQRSLTLTSETEGLRELADGLTDLIVSREIRSGPAYPPQTDIDRTIETAVTGAKPIDKQRENDADATI